MIDLEKLKEVGKAREDSTKAQSDFFDIAFLNWEEIIQALEEAKEIITDLNNYYYDVEEKQLQEASEWLERFKKGQE